MIIILLIIAVINGTWSLLPKGWGERWTTTEIVSTESTGSSHFPSLGVSPDGVVHVAWFDRTLYDDSGEDSDIVYKKEITSLLKIILIILVLILSIGGGLIYFRWFRPAS
jgi:hypothetical protein